MGLKSHSFDGNFTLGNTSLEGWG